MDELSFVHRYIAAPAGEGAKRTLLLLHGTGGDETDLLPLGRALDPEAAILSPRGQVSEHGQLRFFRRLAEGVFDEADVVRRAGELADFTIAAGAKYRFDAASLIAVGYSNGANIAAAVLLLRPKVFAGAILLRAMMPLTEPVHPELTGRRVLIGAGAQDRMVPPAGGQKLAEVLRRGGAEVVFKLQAAGHGLVPQDISEARAWLTETGTVS